jgi:S1-C subfamily serine protease
LMGQLRWFFCWLLLVGNATTLRAADELYDAIRSAQSKVVKIYGAGGLKQMEAYQTGILISSEGHVLTVLSYVLDTDDLAVILDDGRKFTGEILGTDPLRELAVVKLAEVEEPLPYFDLKQSPTAEVGDRTLAISNLYNIATSNEPVSVLQGTITALAPLDARRGAYATSNREQVYVVDAYANNPGAAGGALVNWQGELLGLLGKELKSRVTGTWLNYALPTASFAESVENIMAGRANDIEPPNQLPDEALSAELLGLRLIPDVLPLTPPYIDSVRRDSAANHAGLRPDDLVVFVAGKQVASCRALAEELSYHDVREELSVAVLRDGTLVEVMLQLGEPSESSTPAVPVEEGAN